MKTNLDKFVEELRDKLKNHKDYSEDEIIDNSEYIYVGNAPRNAEEKVIELGL